jgi:hypothetical protein
MDKLAYNELHMIEWVYERNLGQMKLLHMFIFQIRHRVGGRCTFTYMANNDLLIHINNICRPGYTYGNEVYDKQVFDETTLHLVRRPNVSLPDRCIPSLYTEYDQMYQDKRNSIKGYQKKSSTIFRNGPMFTYEEYDPKLSMGNKLLLQLLFHPFDPIELISTHWFHTPEVERLTLEQTIQRKLMIKPPSPLFTLLKQIDICQEEGVIQLIAEYAAPMFCLDEQIFQLQLELDYSKCMRCFIFFPSRDVRHTTVYYNRTLGHIIYEHDGHQDILVTFPHFQHDIQHVVQFIRQDIFGVTNPITDPIVTKLIRQLKFENS